MQELEKILGEIDVEIEKERAMCEDIEDTPGWRLYEKAMKRAKDIIRKHMNDTDTAGDGWIAVDNSPPKEGGTYIIKAIEGDRVVVSFAKWQNRYKRFDLSGRRAYWRIIAYQPLPEP